MKKLRILALFAMMALLTAVAHADTLTWSLNNVTFDDGATASGFFTYDSATNTITNFDIVTTAGSTLSAFEYNGVTSNASPNGSSDFFFSDNPNDRYLRLSTVSPLTSPGTIALGGGPYNEGYECLNCGPVRFITGGDLSSVSDTPEPGSIALLGSGLIGLAGGIRRKFIA